MVPVLYAHDVRGSHPGDVPDDEGVSGISTVIRRFRRFFSKWAIVLVFFLICGLSSRINAQEWTQFRGPDFGRTAETNVAETWDDQAVEWKTELPGRGASSPVVFDGHVYLTAYTGYAIDKKEPGDPAGLVRHLLCFDVSSGDLLWKKSVADDSKKDKFATWGTAKAGYASSSAAVDESGVYVLFGSTGVVAYSHDGEELWRTFCGDSVDNYPAGNSPVIFKDLVIVNASYQSGSLIALRKSDGTEVWKQDGIEESWNTPVIYQSTDGSDELGLATIDSIMAFDPSTGEPKWQCSGFDEYICPSVIAEDGILYGLGGKSGKAMAVRSGGSGDVTETHRLWLKGVGSNVSSPVFHDGYLYWGRDKQGIVYCLDAKSGETMYEKRLKPTPKEIYAVPLLANGRLYYLSRENGVFVIAAKPELELLSHTKFEDDSLFNASPAVLPGGAVLLRSDRYLYRLKPEE